MSDRSEKQEHVNSSASRPCHADREQLTAVLNGMRWQLIREMWYPGHGGKTDIGTVTACVEGMNHFFDDTISNLRESHSA